MARFENEEERNEMRELAHVSKLEEEADRILANPAFWLCFRPDRVIRLILGFKALVGARYVCARLDPDVRRWLRDHPPDEG